MVSCRNLFITWLTAYISSRVVAVVTEGGSFHLWREISLFLSFLILFVLFDCIGIYAQAISIQRISNLLRERLYHSFLFASIPETDRLMERGELISRTNRDVDTASGLLSGGLVVFLMSLISGMGATLIIVKENAWICVFLYAFGFGGLLLQNLLAGSGRAGFPPQVPHDGRNRQAPGKV
jgi:ABC-type multidrug transport system fused ATPase/permease subunit